MAYADFVTAMMALFLVLWLTSQDEKIKEAVERSFRNPFASVTKESTGVIPNKDTQSAVASSGNFDSASAVELNMLRKISEDLLKAFQQNQETDDQTIKMEMTPEGLRVNVFDRGHKPVFESNSPEFTKYGRWLFSTLAWQISRYPQHFLMELEGHTEAGHAPRDKVYTNWELSADRANSARRILQDHGVKPTQVRKVAGFSDTKPLRDMDGSDDRNRRVTVLLRMQSHNLD